MTAKYRIEHATAHRVVESEHELDMLSSLCEEYGRPYNVERIGAGEHTPETKNGSASRTATPGRSGARDA